MAALFANIKSFTLTAAFLFLCFSFERLTLVNSFGAVTRTTLTSAKPRRARRWMEQNVLQEKYVYIFMTSK